MGDFDQELIDEFIVEALDLIEPIEPEMAKAHQLDAALAGALFRPVHSIKGVSASFGFVHIAKVLHVAENILSNIRNGEGFATGHEYLDFYLALFDYLRLTLAHIRNDRTETATEARSVELTAVAEKLRENLQKKGEQASVPADAPAPTPAPTPISEPVAAPVSAPTPPPPADDEFKMEISQEMLDAFMSEALEGFGIVEERLLVLSKAPNDIESVREVFRHMHSFKGNCGIFGLSDLEKLSHRMESLLQTVIATPARASTVIFETCLQLVDVLRQNTATLKVGVPCEVLGVELYLEMLDGFMPKTDAVSSPTSSSVVAPSAPVPVPAKTIEAPVPVVQTVPAVVAEPVAAPVAAQEVKKVIPTLVPAATQDPLSAEMKRQDIRVDIAKLDHLNNLVGELVTAKSMIAEHMKGLPHESVEKTLSFFDRITTDLQDVAMNIRMIPIAGLFKKMIRIVHDISAKSGKRINYTYSGEDTEVDRTVIEKISDPLVHMIRNAVDHGIEAPDDRVRLGKPIEGNVYLSAKNEGSEIWIIVKDDGRGLHRDKILAKAIKNGMMTEAQAEAMTDGQVFSLIFAAGFSTAEKVTDISGRGVGMDVVKQNIDSIKGNVEIQSTPGEGTIFTIKIPLTLAIIQGMLVQVGDRKYSLPIDSIREAVKIDTSTISSPMEGRELVKIRDHMLTVFRLSELHGVQNAISDLEEGILLLIEGRGMEIALLVDRILGQHEAVVKPLPGYFGKTMVGVSGCAILGNGEVGLILDAAGLIEAAREGLA